MIATPESCCPPTLPAPTRTTSPLSHATLDAFAGLSSYADAAPGGWPGVAALVDRAIAEYLSRYAICGDTIFEGYRMARLTLRWADGSVHRVTLPLDRTGRGPGNVTVQTHVKRFCLANAEELDPIGQHARHLLDHCEL